MPALKSWLLAARLRTLPLSISGILMGSGLAALEGAFRADIFLWASLVTLGFQILSNFANDYGDGIKGTDNERRVGPARAMQSGLLTAAQLRLGMIVISVITLCAVIVLIYVAFGSDKLLLSLLFLGLGIAAMIAAVKYTVGKSAYGYRGLGDVFVFLFFGLIGVGGCYFLFVQDLHWLTFFPAITIGCMATIVLHLNNMRDRKEDQSVGKRTLAVVLGKERSVSYHSVLVITAIVFWVAYLVFEKLPFYFWASLLCFIPLLLHWTKVRTIDNHQKLDPELKKVALTTFLLALLFFGLSML
ncbi:MAG: 1,4-dihydroxy-2-naphthoate octaprenyltransferase [Dokdonia sp.]|nr:1,4-dihydroxy-2-naphthoate octaprenyltransferase [Cytophagaceae bacterium]